MLGNLEAALSEELRPGGKVFEMFKSKGAEAARKLGIDKLGLAAHRVNRWLAGNGSGFAKTAAQHSAAAEKPKPKPKKKSAAKKQPAKKAVKKAPAAPQAELQAA
jgi:hypothetical protein